MQTGKISLLRDPINTYCLPLHKISHLPLLHYRVFQKDRPSFTAALFKIASIFVKHPVLSYIDHGSLLLATSEYCLLYHSYLKDKSRKD